VRRFPAIAIVVLSPHLQRQVAILPVSNDDHRSVQAALRFLAR
jgi:hypothetical protein